MGKLLRKESLVRIALFTLVAIFFSYLLNRFILNNIITEAVAWAWYGRLIFYISMALLPISCIICGYVSTREKYHSNFIMEWVAVGILNWLLTDLTVLFDFSALNFTEAFFIFIPNLVTMGCIVGCGVLGTIIARDGLDLRNEDEYMSAAEEEKLSTYNSNSFDGAGDDTVNSPVKSE